MQQIEINSVVYNIIVADAYYFIIQNSVTSFYDLILQDEDVEELARDECYQHGVFTWNMKDTYLTYEEVNAKYREMKLK